MRYGAACSLLLLAALAGTCKRESPTPGLAELGLPPPETLSTPGGRELAAAWDRVERLSLTPDAAPAKLGTAFGRLGMRYHAVGRIEAALICFRQATVLDAQQPRWPYYTGYILETEGRLEEAATALESALALDPRAPWSRLRLADVELARGNANRAAELYGEVLKTGVQTASASAHYGLGRLHLQRHEPRRAVWAFEAALETVPHATRIHRSLAQAYRQIGRESDARRAAQRAGNGEIPRHDPVLAELLSQDAASSRVQRALAAARSGDTERAEAELRQALDRAPENLQARYNLAVLLERSGRAEEAKRQYRAVLSQDPRHTRARFNLGTLLAQSGRLSAAISELERVVEQAPDFTQARFNLAAALVRVERWSEAITHYGQVRRQDPDYPDVGLFQAEAMLAVGRPADAAALLADLVEQNPDRSVLRVYEAQALVALDRDYAARQRLEAGLERRPQDGELLRALIRLLIASEDPRVRDAHRALQLADHLFRAEPTVENGESLAMALAASGQNARALELVDRMLQEVTTEQAATALQVRLRDLRQRLAGGDG